MLLVVCAFHVSCIARVAVPARDDGGNGHTSHHLSLDYLILHVWLIVGSTKSHRSGRGYTGKEIARFFPSAGGVKQGWYRATVQNPIHPAHGDTAGQIRYKVRIFPINCRM